ncbi:hypothetical protein HN371_04315 [Candidatus Poribacteria bacterium]|jgi:hypothetical protein|nr:hypothetical protein [Candidatus Poribacteria bacterium]MBT5536104.1 hypothetical protein [Candidatus Poribacteria bacterium]MBT5714146.1 hypothetical protein [Candidatus Poribacteria bacterium]MBT7096158.1 hypothetical protein [Candidatus Poribacteria bacterium]MBT7806691.1 hypothetical protein [Candidatus Poribacteria bacterium]
MQPVARVLAWIAGALLGTGAFAQDWESWDIGDPSPGPFDDNAGTWTIEANGADIWAAADAFRFTYQETDGDFDLSARIVSFTDVHEWSKVGLMARQSLDAGSPNVFVNLTGTHGVKVIHRDTVGGPTGPDPAEPNAEAPVYLRLVREGDLFTSYLSDDGAAWDLAEIAGAPAEVTLALGDPVFVGVGVTSHIAGTLMTAEIDSVQGSFLPVEPLGKVAATWAALKASR